MQTVMIVEDELEAADALGTLLERAGYRVLKALNGEDALALLQNGERPKVTLLDLMMPVMSGWEFIAELEADPQLAALQVVVLSASSYSESLAGHLFLRKPVDIRALYNVIRERCDDATASSN